MGEHLVLHVDRLVKPTEEAEVSSSSLSSSNARLEEKEEREKGVEEDVNEGEEDEPLIQIAECRICQEEDGISSLEVPCTCSGSLKYAHRKCVQRWCNEKGDITCEICHQVGGWTISGTPLDMHDPRLLAIAEAERQFLEAEYDDYAASSASGAAFCRSAALILMALLLLRHAWTVPDSDDEDDMSAFFSLFLLRAAGFLLPCYIMAWAISILQRRRQRQEAAAMAATQVAFVLQSGQRRGLQFMIAPRSPSAVGEEAV
ncbi:putative E3 ubiquitin ligase SUD1 [Bienertia sinuspersici]